jgi:hypothetical protein
MMLGISLGKDGLRYELDPVALGTLGITEDQFTSAFDQMSQAIEAAEKFIGIGV